MKFIEKIFSVKNVQNYDIVHKIVTILGIKIKFKKNVSNAVINRKLNQIITKLSMTDDIWHINNIKIFVPRYPIDFIQSAIVDTSKFFEQEILEELDKYIPSGATILDLGANIGNHSLYWAFKSPQNVKSIHSFEPVLETYKILETNVNINNANNKIKLYNLGLSDKNCNAQISRFVNSNIGGNALVEKEGELKLVKLDDINFHENSIDFMKIDVEGFELKLLNGAKETLAKYKPLIFIEVWPENYNNVHKFLTDNHYKLVKSYPDYNYLYKYDEN